MKLEDLVYLAQTEEDRIRNKIRRSRVFARVLGFLIIKGSAVRPCEAARELDMDVWLVNRTLILMSDMGVVTRIKRGLKEVVYAPNGTIKQYEGDIIKSLGRGG